MNNAVFPPLPRHSLLLPTKPASLKITNLLQASHSARAPARRRRWSLSSGNQTTFGHCTAVCAAPRPPAIRIPERDHSGKKTGVQKLSLRSQTVKLIFCKSRSDCDDVSNRSNPVVTKTVGETSWDEKVWEVRWRVYLWSGETTCSLQLTRWSQMEEIPMISLTF